MFANRNIRHDGKCKCCNRFHDELRNMNEKLEKEGSNIRWFRDDQGQGLIYPVVIEKKKDVVDPVEEIVPISLPVKIPMTPSDWAFYFIVSCVVMNWAYNWFFV